jgi:beta-1,4-mannosyl-glycoprotein beta-1,4-N-acetylglucosaminyltransferase
MFYNELDMLELRLNMLSDVVDYFVVCEAAETHSGQPKPYNFADHQDRFDRWLHQIIYVQVDNLTKRDGTADRNSWERERYHRFCIADGLTEVRPNDFVIVGDCDEIANPRAVQWCQANCTDGAILELDMYYYSLNHRVRQGWGIGMMPWHLYHDPNNIRTGAGRTFPHINEGGWHFSYFGGPQQIAQKVDAFMHHADVAAALPRDAAYISSKIQAGADLYGRDLQIDRVPLSPSLPSYVLDNIDHYRALGWVAE